MFFNLYYKILCINHFGGSSITSLFYGIKGSGIINLLYLEEYIFRLSMNLFLINPNYNY